MQKDRALYRWLVAGLCLGAITLAFHATPISAVAPRKIFQYLFFLPIVMAALWFGWRGGLAASVAAALCFVPGTWPLTVEQWSEAVDMAIIGSVLGLLAGREQRKARQLETTSLELQRAYERLERNVDQWKHAERLSAFGQLAAGLAHEIRTPLSAIDGALELLRSEKANEELRREMTDIALKESKRLNRLLTDLLEFARPRKPEFRQASLETVVASVARLLEPQTRKQSIDLRWEAAGKLPDVECDPEQIRQVVLNLCMNAIQATGPGGTIRISLARTDAGIETSVADNGPGLAPEISDRLFEPFLTTKPNGTGLGLAVAKQIAENHNGRLSIDSSGSRGATFRLALPLQQIERTV